MYTDKNGNTIQQDDVVFDGQTYWRMNYNTGREFDEEYLLSCEGYKHNLTQDQMSQFEIIGPFEDNKQLLVCD